MKGVDKNEPENQFKTQKDFVSGKQIEEITDNSRIF